MPSGTGTIFLVGIVSSNFLVFVSLLAGRESLYFSKGMARRRFGDGFFSGGATHFFSLFIELVRLFDRYGYCCLRLLFDYIRELKKPRLAYTSMNGLRLAVSFNLVEPDNLIALLAFVFI